MDMKSGKGLSTGIRFLKEKVSTMTAFSKVKAEKLFKQQDITQQIENLKQVLPLLSDEARLAIHFRYWERMSIEEVAKMLGKTWGATDQLIEKAVRELRELILKQSVLPLIEAA